MWYILYLFSGLELSMKNVTNALKPVTVWHKLGIQLGVPNCKLREIQDNYPRDNSTCMSEMLFYWFNNAKEQSWDVIADALEGIDHCKLANEIRGRPSEGMLEYRVWNISLALLK